MYAENQSLTKKVKFFVFFLTFSLVSIEKSVTFVSENNKTAVFDVLAINTKRLTR